MSAAMMIDADHDLGSRLLQDLITWRRDLASGRTSTVLARVLAGAPSADVEQVGRRLYYDGHAEALLREAAAALDRAAARAAGSPRAAEITGLRRRCHAALADVAAIVAKNRAASARPAIDAPPPTGDPWHDLVRDAARFVIRQWRAGFGELVHQNQFPPELSREVATGDVFQRALVADALCDLPEPWPAALAPMLAAELDYLHAARTCPVRGWSYYPGFDALPPDTDLLGQILQVTVRLGRAELLPGFDEPIRQAVELGALGDGSFVTWLVPPPGERAPIHHVQATLVGAPAGDAEVVANLAYGLALLDRERFAGVLAAAVRWIAGEQQPTGAWTATWYVGTSYPTYACVRLLAAVGGAEAALATARRRLEDTQCPDGGWGTALDTALAMLSLAAIDAAAARPALERARGYLAALAPDRWPAVPFIQQGPSDPRPLASRTLTAAYVAKAAARCRG